MPFDSMLRQICRARSRFHRSRFHRSRFHRNRLHRSRFHRNRPRNKWQLKKPEVP